MDTQFIDMFIILSIQYKTKNLHQLIVYDIVKFCMRKSNPMINQASLSTTVTDLLQYHLINK